MELSLYWQIIKDRLKLIVTVLLIVWLGTAGYIVSQPTKYEASVTIAVNKPNPVSAREVSYFQYDKYYSLQASSLYADTLAAWLASPGTAQEIFQTAELPVPNISLKKLAKIFKPRRLPQVTLVVNVSDQDPERATRLIKAVVTTMNRKTAESQQNDNSDNYFNLLADTPVVAKVKTDYPLTIAISTLAGLIIGLSLAISLGQKKQRS